MLLDFTFSDMVPNLPPMGEINGVSIASLKWRGYYLSSPNRKEQKLCAPRDCKIVRTALPSPYSCIISYFRRSYNSDNIRQ